MRGSYLFVLTLVSLFACSGAISTGKMTASESTLSVQASGRGGRFLRVHENDEERGILSAADTMVNQLISTGKTTITNLENLPIDDVRTTLAKVFKKQNQEFNKMMAKGWNPAHIEARLEDPNFRKELREAGLSDEHVFLMAELFNQHHGKTSTWMTKPKIQGATP
ncbi:RxLR effector protein [Phytophthora megakarya]|uniref:RxLR effector protein n=1 Tax=Phytophthora megakarya TaxID=4795 RepID=A0A225X1A0_9STRA|nr:RxLR effector protein [Phytophthora megakarya]